MIKLNKLRYFDVSFRYSRESWGVLGYLGVSWGNKTGRSRIMVEQGGMQFVLGDTGLWKYNKNRLVQDCQFCVSPVNY